MRTDAPFLLLYDGTCRICSAFARAVAILDAGRSIRARSIQISAHLLEGMSEEEALAAAHLVAPDGRVRTGPDVLPALLGALVARPRLEDRLNASPLAKAASDRTYGLLVAVRGRLNCASGASSSAARNPR